MFTEDYNTQQPAVILKEYGRNVQKLANFIVQEKDDEKRARLASTLVQLMKQLNPSKEKDSEDYQQRLWNHLYYISEFELNLPDTEFEKPDASLFNTKPERVEYGQKNLRFRHYGKNIELFIQKAKDAETEEDREAAIIHLGRIMKKFYSTWNKDGVEDELIIKNIEQMSGGDLTIDIEKVKEFNLFYSKEAPRQAQANGQGSSGGHKNNGGRRTSNGGGRRGNNNGGRGNGNGGRRRN